MNIPRIKSLDLTRKRKPTSKRYAAAQSTAMTGDWYASLQNVNDLISTASSTVRARIRQLVRDNSHFSRACNLTSVFLVGSGIRYQSQIVDDSGKLNRKLNQYVEDKFNLFLESIDAGGRLHGYDLQDLCCRQLAECGEFILIKSIASGFRSGEHPLKYQIVEPDHLCGYGNPAVGNEISQGVEYIPSTGRAVRYHFSDDYGNQYTRQADSVIHGFHSLRPGQLRGISDFASGVLLADAFGSYIGSELTRKAMAARWLAFVKSPDPLKFQVGLETSDTGSKLEDIENATIQYLNPLEDITFPQLPDSAGIKDFSELMLQMYSVSSGIPYEILTQDYGSMSFSTAKIKRTDFKNELKPAQNRFVRWHCVPILRDFFRYGVLSGYLDLPGYESDPLYYQRGIWQLPGMEPVDPLREVKAIIEEIKTGLRSPQEYIRSRGADPDEVLAAIAEFRDMAKEYDLDLDAALMGASTMMANNPAKLEPEQDSGAKGNESNANNSDNADASGGAKEE
jgi:lambda family phage portal protein